MMQSKDIEGKSLFVCGAITNSVLQTLFIRDGGTLLDNALCNGTATDPTITAVVTVDKKKTHP